MRRILIICLSVLASIVNGQIDSVALQWADSLLSSMSVDEKIGQFFMIPCYSNKDNKYLEEVTEQIEKYKPGGIIFFQGGPARQVSMINYLQFTSRIPLLIAMDAEWGPAMRLDSCIRFPRQMMLGALADDSLIFLMGKEIARQLRLVGVQMNFAPVLDINTNPSNPVIGSRSFGENRDSVTRKAIAYLQGLQSNNILAVVKHFPGHGDTQTDSHTALPQICNDRRHFDSLELYPFRKVFPYMADGVMTAHLNIPAIDSIPNIPSSISKTTITGLLEKEMGFKGLHITDALNMKAVSDDYDGGDLELLAFNAGNDILLMPKDIHKATHALRKEYRRDRLSMDEINRRCRKILMAKYRAGLANRVQLSDTNLYSRINTSQARYLNRRLIESSLTLVRNDNDIIPLKNLESLKIAIVSLGADKTTRFQETASLYAPVRSFILSKESLKVEYENLANNLSGYNLVIVALHAVSDNPASRFGITPAINEFIQSVCNKATLIISLFGNPYAAAMITHAADAAAFLVSYENTDDAQDLSAQLLFGGIGAKGRLPVSVPGLFAIGAGLETSAVRFKYSMPEEFGISTSDFVRIDSIIYNAISNKAMPGCQLLIAKNSVVLYHKSFGYHTYQNRQQVSVTDIYDIASLTKITATIPALMKLFESHRLDINKPLDEYLPWLDSTNKGNLVIKDILAHQAGLVPWIPFYISTFEPLYPGDNLISKQQSDIYPFKIDKGKYLNKNYVFKRDIFSPSRSDVYSLQVADNLYLHSSYKDTIYNRINNSEIGKKEYRYSDLGYYYFKQIIERMYGMPLERFVDDSLYKPLGAPTIGYLPNARFSKNRLVPTENDIIFRKQIIHGYVHDAGVAMLGGVGGSAGVFASANDVAKIMQMYLNKGCYGATCFFKPSTIDLFTSCAFCSSGNRRALGFDRAEFIPEKESPASKSVSPESFGHTGFTGTIAWADPVTGIVFVFLSNRVHPDQDNDRLLQLNVRTNLQTEVYRLLSR